MDVRPMLHGAMGQMIERAEHCREHGRFAEAARCFDKAASLARQQIGSTPAAQKRWTAYADRLHRLSHTLQRRATDGRAGTQRTTKAGVCAESDGIRQRIDALKVIGRHDWDALVGVDDLARELRALVRVLVAPMPPGVDLNLQPAVLLYGPPGTGKSMIASAVSCEVGDAFYRVNAADLMSKWFGESARLASALYQQARRHDASVVFIDEIDAVCQLRNAQASGAERRLLASLLTGMSGLDADPEAGRVITLAATNTPWDLDRAVLSRFAKRFYVPLPTPDARAALIRRTLEAQGLAGPDDLSSCVAASEQLSARQIVSAVHDAVLAMLQRANPRLRHLDGDGQPTSTDTGLRVSSVKHYELHAAVAALRPDVDHALLERYAAW